MLVESAGRKLGIPEMMKLPVNCAGSVMKRVVWRIVTWMGVMNIRACTRLLVLFVTWIDRHRSRLCAVVLDVCLLNNKY
jgi:hypothetical protein